MDRPKTSDVDEWALFLAEYVDASRGAIDYLATQIAAALDEAAAGAAVVAHR